MNIIEKVIAWGLRSIGSIEYVEHGEVPVEIIHTNAVSVDTNVYGDRTTKINYSKYPLTIDRPDTGSTIVEHYCKICGARLEIKVKSKKTLMKFIKPVAIAFIVSLLLFILLAIFDDPQNRTGFLSNVFGLALFLFLFSVFGLYFLLPLEYAKMGIGDTIDKKTISVGPKFFNAHTINQTPQK